MKANNQLLNLSFKHSGDWLKIYTDIINKEYCEEDAHSDFDYVTMVDEEYPEELKSTIKPPFVLFYKGNFNLLKNNIVSVSTSRDIEQNELETLSNDLLSDNLTYVVGDSENLINALLNTNKQVIVVVPCGIDKFNKTLARRVLEQGGLIVSEFPQGVNKTSENAMWKYRIISGLSTKTAILHAKKSSGSNMLISYALNNNKEVFVLPLDHSKKEYINNDILYDGATPLVNKIALE